MEEDWDSPTGYSPVDPSTVQNTAPAFENQRSRGRGFWKDEGIRGSNIIVNSHVLVNL